jgi:hypothetical protein
MKIYWRIGRYSIQQSLSEDLNLGAEIMIYLATIYTSLEINAFN